MSVLIKNPTTVVSGGIRVQKLDENASGTTVPNSGVVNNVYFNKFLKEEQVIEILQNANFEANEYFVLTTSDGTEIISIFHWVEDLEGWAILHINSETSLQEILWCDENIFSLFGNVPDFNLTHSGWQDFTNPILINKEVSNDVGTLNESLKDIISITEYAVVVKDYRGMYDGETLQANVGGEYFDGKTVDVEKMLDSKKLPLNIDVEYAKIKVDSNEVDLIGEYDGTPIEITENGNFNVSELINEKKIPLSVTVNVGSGEGEEIDTVAIYRQTRNPNWPYLPLPSEIAATSNKDTVYLLYDASGGFVCPTFTIEYNTQVFWSNITIEKYMNTTLVSSETIDGHDGTLVRMQYDYTDEDWDSYNYLLIKIEQQSSLRAYPYLDKLDLTTNPQYNGVDLNAETSNGLLEISGNANICEVLFGGSNSIKNNKDLTYFSFKGIARTSLNQMFNYCFSLITLPEIRFSVTSDYKSTTMSNMFYNCYALQAVPLFDTSNVTKMEGLFYNCRALQTVPLFDTSKVDDMDSMFSGCTALQTVPLFNTSNVWTMQGMFRGCSALQTIPLFDTSKVTGMETLFSGCRALQTVPLFNTSNVWTMQSMFSGCSALQTVPLFDTSKSTTTSQMFSSCYSLQTVPLFDTSGITGSYGMNSVFSGCYSLVDINMYNMKYAFSLSNSTLLTREAIVKVLNNLATVTSTQTLTLGTTNLAKLTDEDKLIATDKGWTLA